MLSVSGMSVVRGNTRVVSDVNFEAKAGEIVAVVGPNGAGKTSLLEAMCMLLPRTGHVSYEGRKLETFAEHARVFSFMPDETIAPDELDVRDVVSSDDIANAPLSSLSRGERKRVEISIALALDRPVVLLDEPFGAFDPLQLDRMFDLVRSRAKKGQTFICSIHQLADAERVADRILLIARGRALAFGTMDEIRKKASLDASASLERVLRALLSASEVGDAA